jgi:hypothetical protein
MCITDHHPKFSITCKTGARDKSGNAEMEIIIDIKDPDLKDGLAADGNRFLAAWDTEKMMRYVRRLTKGINKTESQCFLDKTYRVFLEEYFQMVLLEDTDVSTAYKYQNLTIKDLTLPMHYFHAVLNKTPLAVISPVEFVSKLRELTNDSSKAVYEYFL